MKTLVLVFALIGAAAPASAKTYEIDPAHSSVSFKIRHLVGRVRGRFEKFSGTVDYEKGKPAAWKAQADIETASIDTSVSKRDDHLRNPDFFDAEKCPKISFKSRKVGDVKGGSAKLYGELTMHCVTKPVILDFQISGETKDPWGNLRLGASATGTLHRKDWGLTWNKALEAGGVLVGDDVELELDIELTAPKP